MCLLDKYESQMTAQCDSIQFILESHGIESDWTDRFTIAEFENNQGIDLQMVDLDDCDSIIDVLDFMDSMS